MMNGKNVMKRFSALFLCLVLFMTLLPVGGFAAFTFKTPKLLSLERQGDAFVLTWEKVAGAPSYGIWRKTNSGGWQSIAQGVAGPTYKDTDLTGGNTYTYTVRCLDASGAKASWFDEAGLSKYYDWPCATPTLISGQATGNSFIVKWYAVSGAASYSIWRKDNGSGWQLVKNGVKETSYTDSNVKSGHTYTYTVRALNSSGKIVSWFDTTGVSGTVSNSSWAYSTPVLKSATYVTGGVQITWDAVKNAPLYGVWRKTNDGAWQRIATTTSTSYKDTSVYSGNSYVYTVRVQNKDGKMLSWFDTAGISPGGTTFATPKLQSVSNTAKGVQFVWDPVPNARKYIVFRRDGSGPWHVIKSGVTTNSYLDTDVKSSTDYTYTVRCQNDAGQWASGYESPGLSIRFFPCVTPDITLTSTKEGMKISWPAISGISSYRIYRINNGKWVWIDSTSASTYFDKQVVSGTEYTYAVRCQTADHKTLLSWFNEKTETYYGDINIITKVSYGETTTGPTDDQFLRGRSVVVEWRIVQGAESYRIFRKANGGTQWKALTGPTCPFADIPKTDPRLFVDTQVVSGTEYTYAVRALDANDKFVGEVDTVGKKILYYDAPDVYETVADPDGITVSWSSVAGITKYQVYRKLTTASSWDLIGSTGDLFFTDKNVVPQQEYQYTVRCIQNENIVSGFDRIAEAGRTTAKWLNTPVLVSADLKENTVTLVWMGVDLADRYEVLRRLNDESWQSIAYVDDTSNGEISYQDVFSSMVSGATYTYTVRCVDSFDDPISNYNRDGLTVRFYEVPRIVKLQNKSNGVYLEWNATDWSNSYTIYRKNGDNNWMRIGNSTVSHFTDTTAVNSLTYVYAVSSTDEGSSLSSDFFKDNRVSDSITYYKIPELISIAIEGNGLRIKWAAVDGITDYRLYRKTSGDNSSLTYFDVSAAEYYDTSVSSGSTYLYSVRCLDSSDIVSEFDTDLLKQLYLDTPALGTISATSNSVKITWNAVVGAETYQIYRKDKDATGGWDWIGSVAANIVDYTDTKEVRAGQEYVYTVRAKKGDVVSDFDATGLTVLTPN